MTLTRLRALVAVADTGSVRAAAAALVVSEPAVSAAVSSLAKEIGVPLVERVGRGLQLTPSGRVYVEHARRALGLLEQGASAARGELDPEHGHVRLATVTTAADHVLPAWLAGFRGRHPGVGLRLDVGSSRRVWSLLDDHEVDLVIAGRPPDGTDLSVRAVRPNELVVVAAPSMVGPGSPGEELPWRQKWARATWLMREPGSGTRTTCEALLAQHELEPPRLTLGSNGAVVAGAIAGLGLSLVSRDAVAGHLAAGHLVVVDLPGTPLRRPWHAVVHPGASASVQLLVDDLVHFGNGWRRSRGAPTSLRQSTFRGGYGGSGHA